AAAFNMKGDGSALLISQMSVTGFLGQIKINGSVSDPLKPKLNLRVGMTPLDLSELRVALPDYRELIPKGSVTGTVGLNGELATPIPWHTGPLSATGTLKANLPEYRVVAAAPPAGGPQMPGSGGAAASPAVAESFLPKGTLTEKINMQVGATIGILTKDA